MEGERLKIERWVLFAIVFVATTPMASGLTVSCMMEYESGGAPAVYSSPECGHQWLLARGILQNQTLAHSCQFATLQGRREYQEDRIACKLDCKVSLPDACGNGGLQVATVGVIAIFDGHGGKEASELASELLLDYLRLHVAFRSYKVMLEYEGVLSDCRSLQRSSHRKILKEALFRTIYDIDLKFSQEAAKNNFYSGSTATVALLYDKQILVANVGDSKALLFSKKALAGLGADDGTTAHLSATELTVDHHPDRKDERDRIEAAGGSVIEWGVPRVNGILAMSRSIGDLYLKKYGVIAEPEFTNWQHLTADDQYLVVTSDGIFESLTKTDIADLIMEWNSHVQGNQTTKPSSSSCLSSSSLAECIVNVAYEKGSHDNLSAIVVTLG